MEPDRLNSPHTSAITLEVHGHQLQFSQDPNSKHLGTTVWDASMVLVKFLEKNCRKGRFSPTKLKGKRAIELGAGCGVAGFGMALLGCDVISTDQTEVLPLLIRNVERNTSRIMQRNNESDCFGSIEAAELNWGDEIHIKAVYAENLLEPLLQTILALSGPKTTVLLGYEIRSTNVHEKMLDMWKRNFEVKVVPKSKMHGEYQHPSIHLYIMSVKPLEGRIENYQQSVGRQIKEVTREVKSGSEEDDECISGVNEMDEIKDCNKADDCTIAVSDLHNKKLSEWEARRYGSMAARLLRDIQIT